MDEPYAMINLKSILIIFLLLPINLLAQQYFAGYVISTKGDTSRGYIRYKRWEYNPRSIQFKTEPEGKPVVFSVNDIKYFSIDIGYALDFQKYSGRISMDDANIDHITTQRDTSFKTDTVFLKILRKGSVTLFSYDDALKTRFFVSDAGSQPAELVYRFYMKSDSRENNNNTINEDTYKRQLVALAEKYHKMDDRLRVDINEANYSEAAFEAIVDKINGYTGPDPAKGNYLGTPPKAKLAIMLGVFAGIAYLVFSVMHK